MELEEYERKLSAKFKDVMRAEGSEENSTFSNHLFKKFKQVMHAEGVTEQLKSSKELEIATSPLAGQYKYVSKNQSRGGPFKIS